MGVFAIKCTRCSNPTLWFSGNPGMTWCGECRTAAANRANAWHAHMAIADTVALVKAANANRGSQTLT